MVRNVGDKWPQQGIVALEGSRNLRDLGGYPTTDGRRVKWGLLFRSGALSKLSPAAWDQLRLRGLRTFCDLRTAREREAEPFALADDNGISYWTGDSGVSFADLRETMRSGFANGASARQGMIAGYSELPFEQVPAHRQLFAHLKANRVPLLFNCVAGKDRAGTAAAILLSSLGVSHDLIVEDYVLTNTVYDVERTLLQPRESAVGAPPPAVRAAIAMADPAYIEAALDSIAARHGTIWGYLRDVLDVQIEDLQRIRNAFLE